MASTDVIYVGPNDVTATTANVYTGYEDVGAPLSFTIYAADGTTVVEAISADDSRWGAVEPSRIIVTGLTPATTYVAKLDETPSVSTTFTTLADDPRTATESQWQDLANRVKAKANTSSLSSVATSGSYNDLSNKPTVPTITMTNVDPGEGSALAENNYVAVYGGDPIIMDYSLNEVNTGAKWIDGSAIYKKTINTGALPNNTTKTVAHNISNLGTIINIQGIGISTTGRVKTLPMVEHNAEFTVPMSVYAGNIEITTYSDLSVYTRTYVTLYYTKSSS